MATNFEPQKCVVFVQSTKIGTHENKAIHRKEIYSISFIAPGGHFVIFRTIYPLQYFLKSHELAFNWWKLWHSCDINNYKGASYSLFASINEYKQ